MRKYKATLIKTVKQIVEFSADEVTASSQDRINVAAMHALEEQGAYEEVIGVTLVSTEDVTLAEEKAEEPYAKWSVEDGYVYFRSAENKYEIVKSYAKNEAHSTLFVIIQVLPDGDYGDVLDTFFLPSDQYVPDFEPQYNKYICEIIKNWEL